MPAAIEPSTTFQDNLKRLPPVDDLARIDLADPNGVVVASIENQAGKQGSLAVYRHLEQTFGVLDADAAQYGMALFAEHTLAARKQPGAHPNIDRLLAIAGGADPLGIRVIAAAG